MKKRQKFRGICTVEVLRPDENRSGELVVVDSVTTSNSLHPKVAEFQKNIYNDKYNLRYHRSSAGYSDSRAVCVCLGLNGQKSPIPPETLANDGEGGKYRDFFSAYNAPIGFRLSNKERVIFRTTSNNWRGHSFAKFGTPLTVVQDPDSMSSYSKILIALEPSKDVELLSFYNRDNLNVQYTPNSVFEEGTKITSIGLGIAPSTGDSFQWNDTSEEEKGLVKWDSVIPATQLVLDKEIEVGPKDYLRIKYEVGIVIDFFADPDVFEMVFIQITSNNSSYNSAYNAANWEKMANAKWFSLNKATTEGADHRPGNEKGALHYAVFGSTMTFSDVCFYASMVNHSEIDLNSKSLLEEYSGESFKYEDENTILQPGRIFVGGNIINRYDGNTIKNMKGYYSKLSRPNHAYYKREGAKVVFPATTDWEFPNATRTHISYIIDEGYFNGAYFYDHWLLKDSAVNKTKFNEYTVNLTVDQELASDGAAYVSDYNPETDGELPA